MLDTLNVRRSERADLAEIDALFARSYPVLLKPDYPPSVLVGAVPLISRANPRLVGSPYYFVVTDEAGMILGAGGWTMSGPPNIQKQRRAIGHIRHVVTDHRHTRRGIGRALMSRVLSSAQEAGITRLECQSTLTAVPFYSACGFEQIRQISVPLAPGIDFPAMLMQRWITSED